MGLDEFVDEENPNKSDPSLKDYSYEPDIFSHNFKWITKIFRDKRTGTLVIPSLPYLMPQIYGGIVLGVYKLGNKEINIDITLSDSGYRHTYRHEQGHASKGRDEYEAEEYAVSNHNSYETAA